jgi:metal-responsive CopG/Arc/MetJ family transcriptional regulator
MEQITVRLPEEVLEELEAEADEHGVTRSEHIRATLASRNDDESEAEVERLRDEVAELERDVERLQNEKQLILQEREEKAELAAYVEEERSVEQQWRQAGLGTKLKWRVFGMPEDADE